MIPSAVRAAVRQQKIAGALDSGLENRASGVRRFCRASARVAMAVGVAHAAVPGNQGQPALGFGELRVPLSQD